MSLVSARPRGSSPSDLSPWVKALDVATVALLLLALSVGLFGGFRLYGALGRLSVTSSVRVVVLALAVSAIRHFVRRRPALPEVLRDGLRHLLRQDTPAFSAAWRIGLTTRLGVMLVGYLAVVTVGYGETPPFRISANELWNLGARWDAGWYMGIAERGYDWDPAYHGQQNIAFFPGYPLAMWLAGLLLGADARLESARLVTANAGVLLSLGCFVAALAYLYRLARFSLSEPQALAALGLLSAYPFAFFYGAPYTEALFLLGATAAFLHFAERRFGRAAAWGVLVGLTRPNGCFLSVPLGVMALAELVPRWREWLWIRGAGGGSGSCRAQPARALAAAAAPGLGMLVYSGYVYWLTGNPFTWAAVHSAWGRTFAGLDELVIDRYEFIASAGWYAYTSELPLDLFNGIATLFAAAVVWPAIRRFGLPYGIFILVNLVPPLMAGGLLSMGRITSVLFPAFLVLAGALTPRGVLGWVAVFGALQGFGAVLFYTWRPLF